MAGILGYSHGSWTMAQISGQVVGITGNAAAVLAPAEADVAVELVSCRNGTAQSWGLLTRRGAVVRVNGMPAHGGIVAVGHMDCIQLDGATYLFSDAKPAARIETYLAAQPVKCPRCTRPIESGLMVRCPHCAAIYHQSKDRACWTYAATCTVCQKPSNLAEPESPLPEGF